MKQKNCRFLIAFCALFCFSYVFAQEADTGEFMRIEFEAENAPKDETQEMQRRLSELEFYYSELKAQETKALAAVPANLKNKKFKTPSEKAEYYKKLSGQYTKKLANEELSKKDIKISQSLIILSELYKTQEAIKTLKKEIDKKNQPQNE